MPVAFLALILFTSTVHATMLVNRQQFLNTQVLPQGLWTFGVSHGRWATSNGSYGQNGKNVSNQEYFSRDVDYRVLAQEITDPLERELAEAAFDSYGRADNEIAGRAVNSVDVNQQSNTYILGRGMSKSSMLFVAVPVVTLKTSIRSRFVGSDSLDRLTNQLRAEGQFSQAQEIIDNTRNALHDRLAETGYNPNFPNEFTSVANVFLTHRYHQDAGRKWSYAADSSVVVPAGRTSDVNDFLYLRLNEEQYSVRQSVTGSFRPHPKLETLASTYYHKRFAFEKARRIPLNRTSPLSTDIDPSTRVQYGDSWGASAQLNYFNSDALMFYVGHNLDFKFRDNISGNRFASDRYDALEDYSEQRLSSSYVGIGVNTIQKFLAQKFILPLDLNLQYSMTHAGENTFANQAIAATMMVFYK